MPTPTTYAQLESPWYWLPVGLTAAVVVLPLAQYDHLTALHYLRLLGPGLGVAAVVLGPWVPGLRRIILPLALVFSLAQFGAVTRGPVAEDTFFALTSGLTTLAWAAYLVVPGWRAVRFTTVDWVAAVLALLLVAGLGLHARLTHGAYPWTAQLRVGVALALWLLGRQLAVGPALPTRTLGRLLVAVWLAIALWGVGKVGRLYYQLSRGDRLQAQAGAAFQASSAAYSEALTLARSLDLTGAQGRAKFSLARNLHLQHRDDEAAGVLGLEPGFVARVPITAWQGERGGDLWSPDAACWVDQELFPGQLQVRIIASGDAALGVWPLMRVKLANHQLGDVSVITAEKAPYTFLVDVPKYGEQRLEIHFINDYYNKEPYVDRNLKIWTAEFAYTNVAWER